MMRYVNSLRGLSALIVLAVLALAGMFLSGVPFLKKAAAILFAGVALVYSWHEFKS